MIGEHIHHLKAAGQKDLEIERVDLYLLEDIDADAVIFSWSPSSPSTSSRNILFSSPVVE